MGRVTHLRDMPTSIEVLYLKDRKKNEVEGEENHEDDFALKLCPFLVIG